MQNRFDDPGLDMLRELQRLQQRLDLLESLEFGGASAGGAVAKAVIFADEMSIVAGDWDLFHSTSQNYAYYYQNIPAAVNDELSGEFDLNAGTYDVYAMGIDETTHGIATIYVDGVSLGTLDYYAASSLASAIRSLSNVSIATSGAHTIRWVITGKNASSSDYITPLTKIWFRQ